MNLDIVKYSWVLAKHKDGKWEIEGNQLERLNGTLLEQLQHEIGKTVHLTKVRVVAEHDKKLREAKAEAERPKPIDLANEWK